MIHGLLILSIMCALLCGLSVFAAIYTYRETAISHYNNDAKWFAILFSFAAVMFMAFSISSYQNATDKNKIALKEIRKELIECKAKMDMGEAENLMDCGMDTSDELVRKAVISYHKRVMI